MLCLSAVTDSEEYKKRFNVLKSQYESQLARADKEKADTQTERGERERLQRELDTMTARCSLLQRQLDKQTGKPSTSSGSDKSSTEPPPTANIKPMAGPSTPATKQQASLHSVMRLARYSILAWALCHLSFVTGE